MLVLKVKGFLVGAVHALQSMNAPWKLCLFLFHFGLALPFTAHHNMRWPHEFYSNKRISSCLLNQRQTGCRALICPNEYTNISYFQAASHPIHCITLNIQIIWFFSLSKQNRECLKRAGAPLRTATHRNIRINFRSSF